MTKWIVAPAAIGIVISAIYGLRAVSNIFFGQAKESFKERLESGQITDLQALREITGMHLNWRPLANGYLSPHNFR